ncbi:hypothetical protein [Lewinella sp. IMCC34183]|uniref:hypothetical protein n=1 Tax=Lewinella sp. IMCC34183 TaxID=2248762 RepID=UPI000E21FA5D|nr:hypothetical protein [Lewinella sp. IMCC34183]
MVSAVRYLLLLCSFLFIRPEASAQDHRWDVRFGAGSTLLTLHSRVIASVEGEVNFTLNRYFTLAGSVGAADSDAGEFSPKITFLRSDVGVFISPFTNQRKHDFRLGVAGSYLTVDSPARSTVTTVNGEVVHATYENERRGGFGGAVYVDHTYTVTDRVLLGLRLAARAYDNTLESNVDALLRIGLRL